MNHSRWHLLQLVDGTFPSGGFAHSSGLEATALLGPSDLAVDAFLRASLCQAGRAALPFVRAANGVAADLEQIAALDDAFDAMIAFVPPNHASRAQGRALASAAARVWDAAMPLGDHVREHGPGHHAVVFGALFGVLGASARETCAAYLHCAARTILSAAVRLGIAGPLEAQRTHAESAPLFDEVLDRAEAIDVADAAQTWPLQEMYSALHDRLDGRMFQS